MISKVAASTLPVSTPVPTMAPAAAKLSAPGDTTVGPQHTGGKPGVRSLVQRAQRDIDNVTWAYAIHQVEGSKNPDVVYFLTTIDGNATMWKSQFERRFLLAWEGRNAKLPSVLRKDPPAVVCIAMDPDVFGLKLLDTVNADGGPGKLQAFVETIMPEVEGRLTHEPAARHFLGMSMGGFNSLQVLWHHPELVTSLALVAPMIPPSPHDAEASAHFAKRTGADEFNTNAMTAMLRDEYETTEEWLAADPLKRAESALSDKSPPLYVHMNVDDDFGFFENTVRFANTARERGVDVRVNVAKGGHGDHIDMKALARHIFAHSS